MANKRMFNIKIVDSDAFLDMPLSTQCLYFHLNMRADDDGFVGNPKRIQRLIGASEDDLKLLIAKNFILTFENGVIVIKHWRMHNTLQQDRYQQTVYTDELKQLAIKDNKSYSLDKSKEYYLKADNVNKLEAKCLQNVSTDIDKDKDIDLDKDLVLDIDTDKEKASNASRRKETFPSIINNYTTNDDLIDVLNCYVEMRKKEKKFTPRALKINLTELDKLALDDLTKIDIINQTIGYGWKGFYPLKKEKQIDDGINNPYKSKGRAF